MRSQIDLQPSFRNWSRHAGTKPAMWPEAKSVTGITVRLIPAFYLWVPVVIEQGDPDASITINRAMIRFPEPFDQHGLTDACRQWISNAVRHAVEQGGFRRAITWPESSSHHHRRSA